MGIIVLICLVIALFTCGIGLLLTPLCLLGLLIREDYHVCGECAMKLP